MQTAVNWLYDYLFPKQLDGFSDEEWDKIDKAFELAKEMEKQQIIDTYNQGLSNGGMDYKKFNNAIHYFFETYGSKGSENKQ